MKNKHRFNYPIEKVFDAIADLVVSNANVHVEEKYSVIQLDSIDYTYEVMTKNGPLKNKVVVNEVVPNKTIAYTITRQKFETYYVTFELKEIESNLTELQYEYSVLTEKSRVSLNHKIVSYLYRGEQKRKFKAMCDYIENMCKERM